MVGGGISVLVVDDHPAFADALRTRLASEPDLRPVDVAYTATDALQRLRRGRVDVAVLDHLLLDTTGTELAGAMRITSPCTEIAVLSAIESVDVVVDAFNAGVRAWLPKTVGTAHLVRVIRGVHAGEMWLEPALLGKVLPRVRAFSATPEPDPLDILTPREREILDLMADGLDRAEIAVQLHLSTNTVRTHVQNLMGKLGTRSSLEAVALVLRLRYGKVNYSGQ